jgi:hypothetical protein
MRLARHTPLAAALLLFSVSSLHAQTGVAPGHWEGIVHMPNQDVPVAVDLARGQGDAWIGSLTIPGATAADVPLSHITIDSANVHFTVALPESPNFDATFSADATALSGEASTVKGAVRFEMKRSGDAHVKLPPPSSAWSSALEGKWEGAIDVNGQIRHVAMKLSPAADGTATGSLFAVDDDNQEIPVTAVIVQNKQLQVEAAGIGGRYRGTFGAAGEIAGEWSQGPVRLPLTFTRAVSSAR